MMDSRIIKMGALLNKIESSDNPSSSSCEENKSEVFFSLDEMYEMNVQELE